MSTTDRSPLSTRTVAIVSSIVLVVVVTGWLALREYAPGTMGNGFLTGGLATYVLFLVVAWRAHRSPASLTAAERELTHAGDERDASVSRRSLAFVGAIALPLTSVGAIAIAVGVDPAMIMALLLWTLLLSHVASFAVIDRRS